MVKQVGLLMGLLFMSSSAAAADLGSMAEGIYGPVEFLTQLMDYAVYITGAAFIIGAIMQFRIHLKNPKLTPLFTPVLMGFLGICLLIFPYVSVMFGNSWKAQEQNETYNQGEIREAHNPISPYDPRKAPAVDPNHGHWGATDKSTKKQSHWGDAAGEAEKETYKAPARAAEPKKTNGGGHWSDGL